MSDKEYKKIDDRLKKKFANYECEGQMSIDDFFEQENEAEEEREEER